MKTAAISGALIAALAAGAVAIPTVSAAQPYGYASDCRRSDGTAGTIIGGIAGAVLGSNLAAHHGGRAGGAAIGGVAGALIGNSIARGSDGCRTYSQGYGYDTRYSGGYAPAYSYGYNDGYAPTYGYGYGDSYAPTYGYTTVYGRGHDRDDYRYRSHDRDRYRDHRDHDRDDDGDRR
jgi:hypothetical protein